MRFHLWLYSSSALWARLFFNNSFPLLALTDGPLAWAWVSTDDPSRGGAVGAIGLPFYNEVGTDLHWLETFHRWPQHLVAAAYYLFCFEELLLPRLLLGEILGC